MSHKIFLIAFLFLIRIPVSTSQSANGHLVKLNGKSIAVNFAIPIFHEDIMNPLPFQNRPQIIVNKNKLDIDLSDYIEARFQFGGRSYIFRRFTKIINGVDHYQLKHLIQDGDVQLYRNYFSAAFVSEAVTSDFFLVDANDKNIPLKPINFKKKLSKFFGSCPKFADIIKRRKFKYKHLDEIVAEIEISCN